MNISDIFIGKLTAGQADVEGWRQNPKLSQVHEDGLIYFYRANGMTLEEFKIAAEVAFEADAEEALIWDESTDQFRIYM